MGPALLLRRQEGFTLNEILISIALIAIGILAFSVNTVGVIQGNRISGNYTIATNLARDKIAEIRVTGTTANSSDSPTVAGGASFSRSWTIATSSLNSSTGQAAGSILYQVTVTVSWTEYSTPRSVVLTTLMYLEA